MGCEEAAEPLGFFSGNRMMRGEEKYLFHCVIVRAIIDLIVS